LRGRLKFGLPYSILMMLCARQKFLPDIAFDYLRGRWVAIGNGNVGPVWKGERGEGGGLRLKVVEEQADVRPLGVPSGMQPGLFGGTAKGASSLTMVVNLEEKSSPFVRKDRDRKSGQEGVFIVKV